MAFLAAGVSDGTQKLGNCLSFPLVMLDTDEELLDLDDPAGIESRGGPESN